LDIRRKFFTQRLVMHWNRLPKEVVDTRWISYGHPTLEAFKARLDVALGSLVWWLATLHIAGGLKLDDHCGPFQPRPFYDSKILWFYDSMISVTNAFLEKLWTQRFRGSTLPKQNKTKKANNKSNKQTKTYFQFHSKHHKKIVHEVFVINIVPFYK